MQEQADQILKDEVTYKGEGISVRELERAIDRERTRQNRNVETLSDLRNRTSEIQSQLSEEVDKIKELTEHLNRERERSDFRSSIRQILGNLPWFDDQIITRKSIEQLLRNQYEISSRRLKEASEFADRLEASKQDLYDEIDRLNEKIVESSKNEEVAAERVLELTRLKDKLEIEHEAAEVGSTEARELQLRLDKARRKLAEHSTKLKLYASAEERLAKLQRNTRQLAKTIANLQEDITTYVTAASEKLDLIAGQIQAIGAAADASTVMLELKNSLDAMTESINHTTQFVSETQTYFRQNVDRMVDDLELYDDETEQVLNENLALNDMVNDERIAEAVSTALVHEMDDEQASENEEVTLDEVKEATIQDLEKMSVDAK
jgi:predicted  nucleic acid-binding Zn-ribbon protein